MTAGSRQLWQQQKYRIMQHQYRIKQQHQYRIMQHQYDQYSSITATTAA